MTAGDSTVAGFRLAGGAFAVVLLSVAANLLAFQGTRPGAVFETAAIGPRGVSSEVSAGYDTALAAQRARPVQTQIQPQAQPQSQSQSLGPPLRAPSPADAAASTAEIVRGIQRELNARGYDAGPPDGVSGLVTRAAIMAYEHDYGFGLTATPSQDLLSRIVLGASAPATGRRQAGAEVSGEAGSVVRMTEQALSSLGYQPGKGGGKFSDQMARAIREFELDQKLPESGRISGPMMSRLLRLQGQTPPVGQTSQVGQTAKASQASQPGQQAPKSARATQR